MLLKYKIIVQYLLIFFYMHFLYLAVIMQLFLINKYNICNVIYFEFLYNMY